MGDIQSGRRAVIMGIGTAVPPNVLQQSSFTDYYFEITNSNHMVDLKAKFTKLCENTKIEKRPTSSLGTTHHSPPTSLHHLTFVKSSRMQPCRSLVRKLRRMPSLTGAGTYLVFCTMVSGSMPGADFELVKLLGLPLSTRRFMMYQAGCHGGGISLPLAKDLAENNPGARVLIVCSEVTAMAFRGPSESHLAR
ncbi:hypothetical protein ZWY2020_053928 [Hordeum vulgare]|nr:hypothetical protein ZWY2020_053928 [Hordeum vulgare]